MPSIKGNLPYLPSAMFKTQRLMGQGKSMDINTSNVIFKNNPNWRKANQLAILQTTAQDPNSRDLREPRASPGL